MCTCNNSLAHLERHKVSQFTSTSNLKLQKLYVILLYYHLKMSCFNIMFIVLNHVGATTLKQNCLWAVTVPSNNFKLGAVIISSNNFNGTRQNLPQKYVKNTRVY